MNASERMKSKDDFYNVLERERSRTDRAGFPFTLVLFNVQNLTGGDQEKLQQEIRSRIRLTDEAGWIDRSTLGFLLYNSDERIAWKIAGEILKKGTVDPSGCRVYPYPPKTPLKSDVAGESGSCEVPEWAWKNPVRTADQGEESFGKMEAAAPDCPEDWRGDIKPLLARKAPMWKRSIDILGSLAALVILSPLFLALSLLIKIVSPGSIFFKQERIGYAGKKFEFLKFRTMKAGADPAVHRKYWGELINGNKDGDRPMIKLDDRNPQIIPFGRLIRKSYLDELPQLINVLRGDMSLVGARPPIPYEVDQYLLWHNSRFDSVPGMTGLWQVSGKNRLSFKEMVRLDIRYSRRISIFEDLRIIVKTPFAILSELTRRDRKEKPYSEGAESHV